MVWVLDNQSVHIALICDSLTSGIVSTPILALIFMPRHVNSSVGASTLSLLMGRPSVLMRLFRDKKALFAACGEHNII